MKFRVSLLAVLGVCATAPAFAAAPNLLQAPLTAPSERPAMQVAPRLQLLPRAEAGDAGAQYQLGLDYQLGLSGPRDLGAARNWFSRSALQNNPKAMGASGFMMLMGQGGPVDPAGAEAMLERAGQLGEPSALANLAEARLLRLGASALPEAVRLLEQAVAAGAVNARYRLGRLLYEGDGIPRDLARGIAMLEEAAARDNPSALVYLGYQIATGGEGLPHDDRRAFDYTLRAAEMGLDFAENELGRYFENGVGVAKDIGKAAFWYRRAFEQGEPNAAYNLAMLARDGHVPDITSRDLREMFRYAAEAGIPAAQGQYGLALRQGLGGPRDVAASLRWLRMAAEGGDANGQNRYGMILFNGDGVPADPAAGMDWLEKAVAQDFPAAINNFSTYLAAGRGRPADQPRALALITRAAEAGITRSQFRLGLWYETGYAGTPKDLPRAIGWFQRAAESGSGNGAFKYAAHLEAGIGIKADQAAALHWYRIAADRKNGDALFLLARYYFNGEGVPQDPAAAIALLRRAAQVGHPEGLFVYGDFLARGQGVTMDAVAAWAHWAVAERLGLAEAGASRRQIERGLRPDEIQRAQTAAAELLAEALAIKGESE